MLKNIIKIAKRATQSSGSFCAAVMLTANASAAEIIRCDLTQWRGADENTAVSWVGVGFEAQPDRSLIRIIDEDGMTGWTESDVRRTSDFITFVIVSRDDTSSGAILTNRYSFRIYNRGRCETRMQAQGYAPIIGTGTIR